MLPVLSPIVRIGGDLVLVEQDLARRGEQLGALVLDRPRVRARLLDERRHDAGDGVVRQAPLRGELQQRQVVALGDRAQPLELLGAGLDPAVGAERAVVARREGVAGLDVVPEQAAVVDDARHDVDVVLARGAQAQLGRPGLERVEDDHRPVDQLAEALEAVDDVQREAVGGARRDAEAAGEALVADGAQRLPDGLARVAGAVGVVQQQQVEGVDPEALEAALGRHPHVVGVPVRPAQARVGEARVALGALALALVEVVPDRADDADAVAVGAGERAAEQAVGLARAVGVGGQQRVQAVARGQQRLEALLADRLAEMQVAAAAPGADRGVGGRAHAA